MMPNLNKATNKFKHVDICAEEVGKFIGGKVYYNIHTLTKAEGRFENACAIRLSYVLNNTELKFHIFRVK